MLSIENNSRISVIDMYCFHFIRLMYFKTFTINLISCYTHIRDSCIFGNSQYNYSSIKLQGNPSPSFSSYFFIENGKLCPIGTECPSR